MVVVGPPRAPEQNRGRYNRNAAGYGGGRGQGGRNNWQNGATSNWGGNNQGRFVHILNLFY